MIEIVFGILIITMIIVVYLNVLIFKIAKKKLNEIQSLHDKLFILTEDAEQIINDTKHIQEVLIK